AMEAAATVAYGDAPAATGDRPSRPFELAGDRAEPYPDGVIDAYPATALQLDMLRATERDPAQAAYHDVFTYRLAVRLDEPALRRRLRPLRTAHDAFRTAFAPRERLQLVYERVEPRLEILEPGSQAEFDAWFEAEKAAVLPPEEPGLMRVFARAEGPDAFTL